MITRYYEVKGEKDVLCFLPSGKPSKEDQLKYIRQSSQKGDTCWYYAPKMLFNLAGARFESQPERIRHGILNEFRKYRARIDFIAELADFAIDIKQKMKEQGRIDISDDVYISAVIGIKKATLVDTEIDLVKSFIGEYQHKMEWIESVVEFSLKVQSHHLEEGRDVPMVNIISASINALGSGNDLPQYLDSSDRALIKELVSADFSRRKDLIKEARFNMLKTQSKYWEALKNNAIDIYSRLKKVTGSVLEGGADVEDLQDISSKKISDLDNFRACCVLNEFIFKELEAHFGLESVKFSSAEELKAILETKGALCIAGKYGKSFYKQSAKDSGEKIGSRAIKVFDTTAYLSPEEIEANHNMLSHEVVIIGIRYCPESPNESAVIFLDPNDPSTPGEDLSLIHI